MKIYTQDRLYCFGLKMLLCIQTAMGDPNQHGCLVQGGISRCFIFHEKAEIVRTEASTKCNSSGSHLAMVDSDEVSSIMNKTSYRRGWFRLRYVNYGNLTFINNRTDSSSLLSMIRMPSAYHRCVAFDTQNGFISTACSERNAFLCQVQNKSGCSSLKDGSCFAFVNTSLSWYEARYKCLMDHGGDLITPQNNLTVYLNHELNITGVKVWIGAANGAWVWRDGENDPVLGEAMYSNWASGHPNGGNDCAVVNLTEGTWESIGCNSGVRYYICELATLVSTTSPLEDVEGDGEQRIIIIAVACGGGGLLVITFIIVAAVTLRRRKSEQKRSDSEDDLTPRNSTAYELGSQHAEGSDNADNKNIAHKPTQNSYEDVPEFNEHKGEMHGAMGSSNVTSSVDDQTDTNRNDDTGRTGTLQHKISDQGNLYAVPVKANDGQVFVTEENDLYNK